MLHITQPVKFSNGNLAIYLGIDMDANNPNGETVILNINGDIKRVNSFDSPTSNPNRKWMYSHILDSNGNLVYKIFSIGNMGFFGYADDLSKYPEVIKQMKDYLIEISQYQDYDLPEVMASIFISLRESPVFNSSDYNITMDDFYDFMNIPIEARNDFATAAIYRQALELVDGVK